MAEVYRAKAFGAHGFEKDLAIKRILPELAQDPEFEQRFIGEAKLAVKLSHANIVQVMDFGRFGGTLFIAMEYVDGLDLALMLKRCRDRDERVPIPAAFQIAVEIARGLDFAHQHGVVHRDVSPSNILLSRAGEVKIADFGIAQAQAVTEKAPKGNRRRIMGKWRYMSPEQTRGQSLTTKSDLFSAASVMYELFTGEKLFPGDESEQIITNIHTMAIPKPSERRPGLPPRLDSILSRALERRPSTRPQKAAEMLRELIEVSYESSIVATALDVADAVKAVLADDSGPSGTAGGIDDLIRQQLGGAMSAVQTQRKTAVGEDTGAEFESPGAQTGVTIVRAGVDEDGVTILEFDETVAAAPSALRQGRRPSGSHAALSDSPAGRSSMSGSAANARRPLGVWIGTGLTVAAIAVAGSWAARSSNGADAKLIRTDVQRVVADLDAGTSDPEVERAMIDINSVPEGAQVRVNGNLYSSLTPTEIPVDSGVAHRIEIALDGYKTWTDNGVVARPGERIRVRSVLTALTAALQVTTRPPGATVRLGGEVIGTTPFRRDDLRPGRGLELVIAKDEFYPVTASIDLEDGKPLEINRSLRSSIVYGKINLSVSDQVGGRSWADVYFRGKTIGQAPGTMQLPVGKHLLKLINPSTDQRGTVTVTVYAQRVETYSARLE